MRVHGAGANVALLRGINVGGKNILPMKDLVALFVEVGCSEVSSYIQSGNVIFRARPALVAGLSALIGKGIADRFGIRVPVVIRTAEELRDIARGNPFLKTKADPAMLHVAFLADVPSAPRVAMLDANRSPPDAYSVHGREIFLHCPNGFGRTKLTNQYFDSKLATISTVRNWRTVLKLLELAGG